MSTDNEPRTDRVARMVWKAIETKLDPDAGTVAFDEDDWRSLLIEEERDEYRDIAAAIEAEAAQGAAPLPCCEHEDELSPHCWACHPEGAAPRHKAEQDQTMTIADGMSRCTCGRMIAEVGTIRDRHWLHVEEPWNEGAAPLDASDPIAQAKFSLHRLARTTEDAQYINRIVSGLAARLSEGADPHPRTYSLVGGGLDMFLVTDDESGQNIGYARKIGGPITAPIRGAAPPVEGPPEGRIIGDRFVSDEAFDAAIPSAPRAEGPRHKRLYREEGDDAPTLDEEPILMAAPRAEGLDDTAYRIAFELWDAGHFTADHELHDPGFTAALRVIRTALSRPSDEHCCPPHESAECRDQCDGMCGCC